VAADWRKLNNVMLKVLFPWTVTLIMIGGICCTHGWTINIYRVSVRIHERKIWPGRSMCRRFAPWRWNIHYFETSITTNLHRITSEKNEGLMTKICNVSPSYFRGCNVIGRFCAWSRGTLGKMPSFRVTVLTSSLPTDDTDAVTFP